MAGLKVNFSDEEVSSEAREFTALPAGAYHCYLTEIEDVKIKDNKEDGSPNPNAGKPYWKITYTVDDEGQPANKRKFWSNVMLFEGKPGTLSNLAQLMKATGNEDVLKSGKIPDGESLVGSELEVIVSRKRDAWAMKDDPTGPVIFKNEVRGVRRVGEGSSSGAKGNSLLP